MISRFMVRASVLFALAFLALPGRAADEEKLKSLLCGSAADDSVSVHLESCESAPVMPWPLIYFSGQGLPAHSKQAVGCLLDTRDGTCNLTTPPHSFTIGPFERDAPDYRPAIRFRDLEETVIEIQEGSASQEQINAFVLSASSALKYVELAWRLAASPDNQNAILRLTQTAPRSPPVVPLGTCKELIVGWIKVGRLRHTIKSRCDDSSADPGWRGHPEFQVLSAFRDAKAPFVWSLDPPTFNYVPSKADVETTEKLTWALFPYTLFKYTDPLFSTFPRSSVPGVALSEQAILLTVTNQLHIKPQKQEDSTGFWIWIGVVFVAVLATWLAVKGSIRERSSHPRSRANSAPAPGGRARKKLLDMLHEAAHTFLLARGRRVDRGARVHDARVDAQELELAEEGGGSAQGWGDPALSTRVVDNHGEGTPLKEPPPTETPAPRGVSPERPASTEWQEGVKKLGKSVDKALADSKVALCEVGSLSGRVTQLEKVIETLRQRQEDRAKLMVSLEGISKSLADYDTKLANLDSRDQQYIDRRVAEFLMTVTDLEAEGSGKLTVSPTKTRPKRPPLSDGDKKALSVMYDLGELCYLLLVGWLPPEEWIRSADPEKRLGTLEALRLEIECLRKASVGDRLLFRWWAKGFEPLNLAVVESGLQRWRISASDNQAVRNLCMAWAQQRLPGIQTILEAAPLELEDDAIRDRLRRTLVAVANLYGLQGPEKPSRMDEWKPAYECLRDTFHNMVGQMFSPFNIEYRRVRLYDHHLNSPELHEFMEEKSSFYGFPHSSLLYQRGLVHSHGTIVRVRQPILRIRDQADPSRVHWEGKVEFAEVPKQ